MKTTKLFATAAIAAFALAGCSKGEPAKITETAPKTVTVSVASGLTRAIDKTPVTTGYKTPIHDVVLYFLDGNNRIVSTVQEMNGGEINEGKTFANINASAVKVYVVANVKNFVSGNELFSGLKTIPLNHTRAEIEAMASSIVSQMDQSVTGVDHATLSGEASFTPTAASQYAASVVLTPAVSRFEITSVTADQSHSDKVTAFDLTGIYMNTFYSDFTVGGGYGGTYTGALTTQAALNNIMPVMKDDNFSKSGSLTYRSSADKVWAYMMPAGDTAPIIVFRLENVQVNGAPTTNTTKYITVKSFRNADTNELLLPKRGEVYVINDVLFTPDKLTDTPNEGDISVNVKVEVKGWTVIPYNPEY